MLQLHNEKACLLLGANRRQAFSLCSCYCYGYKPLPNLVVGGVTYASFNPLLSRVDLFLNKKSGAF